MGLQNLRCGFESHPLLGSLFLLVLLVRFFNPYLIKNVLHAILLDVGIALFEDFLIKSHIHLIFYKMFYINFMYTIIFSIQCIIII